MATCGPDDRLRHVRPVSVYRWVQRFTAEFIEAVRPCRHAPADRWFVDETYVKVAGRWTYLYRAIDQHGQIIDVLLSTRRDCRLHGGSSSTRRAPEPSPWRLRWTRRLVYSRVLDELVRHALHPVEQYANNSIEADHVDSNPASNRCAASSDTAQSRRSPRSTRSSRSPRPASPSPSRGFVLRVWQLSFVRPRASPR